MAAHWARSGLTGSCCIDRGCRNLITTTTSRPITVLAAPAPGLSSTGELVVGVGTDQFCPSDSTRGSLKVSRTRQQQVLADPNGELATGCELGALDLEPAPTKVVLRPPVLRPVRARRARELRNANKTLELELEGVGESWPAGGLLDHRLAAKSAAHNNKEFVALAQSPPN